MLMVDVDRYVQNYPNEIRYVVLSYVQLQRKSEVDPCCLTSSRSIVSVVVDKVGRAENDDGSEGRQRAQDKGGKRRT
jgi:hypothetical protein